MTDKETKHFFLFFFTAVGITLTAGYWMWWTDVFFEFENSEAKWTGIGGIILTYFSVISLPRNILKEL